MSHKQMLPSIIVVMLVILFLIGCGGQLTKEPSTQESIIGVWQDPVNTSNSVQFKEDGTVEISSVNGPTVKGTYKIVESLVVELPNSQKEFLPIVSISENELVLDSHGNVTTFRRAGAPAAPANSATLELPAGPADTGVSPEIQQLVVNNANPFECGANRHPTQKGCQDFNVTCVEKPEPSPADRANGIEEKWCVEVSYIYNRAFSEEWADGKSTLLVIKRNGTLEAGPFQQCVCQSSR